MGARPELREPEDFEPGTTRDGWQHEAASRVEKCFREANLFPRMGEARKVLTRSQGGPGAGLVLSTCPVDRLTTFTPASVQGDHLPSLPPSSAPHRAQLQVWPTTTLLWPPPSRSVGGARMGSGERGCKNMPRGRGQGDHQRVGAKPGPRRKRYCRQLEARSGR